MTLVKDLYDKLAIKTGFPLYTNEFDTPDITRFLLDVLSEALQSTIDSLYISNNILERNDTLTTIPNKNLYGIEGIIKNIQIKDERGTCYSSLKYADDIDQNDNNERFGKPVAYAIKNGYLKLLPTPDKEYTIKLCVSTTDLVLADDDTSRTSIEHIEDSIAGSDKFCDLVVLSACALTFTRCNNPLAQVYRDLYENRLRTFMEHDLGTMEAQRFTNPDAGHYDSMRGLIRDDFRRGVVLIMAKPFQKQKPKVSKDTGNYVFSNFTEGLYQLDTPRGLPEQLGSLAITDGRNVFTERGALIPQYGYLEKAKIPAGEAIVGVTEDSKSNSSVFIMCMSGTIYYYSSYNGLKKYKTVTDFLSEDIIYTRMNNNVVIGVGTNAFTFGGYYKESEYVEIINGANVQNFGSYITLEVPYKYEDYFWRGKIVAIPDVGAFNINSITASTAYTYSPIQFSSLNINNEWTLEGEISVNDSKRNVIIDPATGLGLTITSKVIAGSATTTVTKEVTKYQCYKYTFGDNKALTTNMKGIKKSGYFYTQGEAGLNKLLFRYEDGSKLAPDGYKLTQTTYTAQIATFTAKYQLGVQSMSGNSANKFGCKALNTNPVPDNFAYAGTLTRYPDGDVKETVTEEVPAGTSKTMYNVTFTIPLVNTTLTFTTGDINASTYTWSIHNDVVNKKFVLQLKSGSTVIVSKDLANTSSEQLKCYSQNPDGYSSNGIKLKDANGEVLNYELGGVLSMVATPYNEEVNMDNLNTNTCSVGEQTLLPITLVYKPEDKTLPEQTIVPKLFGSATNRLLIYDVSGTIYYSAVGILDEFSEVAGAGYFRDFYNDTSECLGIEDYLNGCLITKQNGLYYVTINDLFNSQSVSADSTIGLNIKKVSEIGQEYAGDHIIVSDIVYAFDSNSGSLVIGCYQNAFGNVVSGEVLVPSEYVGSVDLGITEQRRKLVYSSEAEVFILYYGASMKDGLVLTKTGSLFPRQLNKPMFDFVRFNQGIMSVADDGSISMDFKRGTIVPELSPVAVFEQIGLAGSNLIQCSIIEVIELNGINYQLEVANAGVSVQKITSQMDVTVDNIGLPPLLYSTDTRKNDSFGTMPNEEDLSLKELSMIKDVTKWALKKSNLTRIYAPASGREGVRLTFEFQPNVAFCLVGIRLADFSRGE